MNKEQEIIQTMQEATELLMKINKLIVEKEEPKPEVEYFDFRTNEWRKLFCSKEKFFKEYAEDFKEVKLIGKHFTRRPYGKEEYRYFAPTPHSQMINIRRIRK